MHAVNCTSFSPQSEGVSLCTDIWYLANKEADWLKDDLNWGSSKETGTNLTFRAREIQAFCFECISPDNLLLKVRLVKDLLLSTSKPLKSVFHLKHNNKTTSYFYWYLTNQLQFLVLLHSLKDFLKCFIFNGTLLIDCPGSITCSCYIHCSSKLMISFFP